MYQGLIGLAQLFLEAQTEMMQFTARFCWSMALAAWMPVLAGQAWLLCAETKFSRSRKSTDAAPATHPLGESAHELEGLPITT